MNTGFKGRIVVSLYLVLWLASFLFLVLNPALAYSRPSPRLHNGPGYKPHPQDSGFHGMAESESRSQPEPGRA